MDFLDLLQRSESIHLGDRDIHEHSIGVVLKVVAHRIGSTFGLDDLVPVVLQHLAREQTHERCIVEDRNLATCQFSSTRWVEVMPDHPLCG